MFRCIKIGTDNSSNQPLRHYIRGRLQKVSKNKASRTHSRNPVCSPHVLLGNTPDIDKTDKAEMDCHQPLRHCAFYIFNKNHVLMTFRKYIHIPHVNVRNQSKSYLFKIQQQKTSLLLIKLNYNSRSTALKYHPYYKNKVLINSNKYNRVKLAVAYITYQIHPKVLRHAPYFEIPLQ